MVKGPVRPVCPKNRAEVATQWPEEPGNALGLRPHRFRESVPGIPGRNALGRIPMPSQPGESASPDVRGRSPHGIAQTRKPGSTLGQNEMGRRPVLDLAAPFRLLDWLALPEACVHEQHP